MTKINFTFKSEEERTSFLQVIMPVNNSCALSNIRCCTKSLSRLVSCFMLRSWLSQAIWTTCTCFFFPCFWWLFRPPGCIRRVWRCHATVHACLGLGTCLCCSFIASTVSLTMTPAIWRLLSTTFQAA